MITRMWLTFFAPPCIQCHTSAAAHSASEMTYIVSSGALNSTHSLQQLSFYFYTKPLSM